MTAAEASDLYDRLLEVADCMRGLGFAVPDPPSRRAFVEQLTVSPVPQWHPHDVVYESGNMNDIQRVEDECPAA